MNRSTDPLGSAEHTWGTPGLEDSSTTTAAASVNTMTTATVTSLT